MKAFELLGLDKVPVLFRESMSEALLRELELLENLHRKDMKWQETACQVYAIHKLRVAEAAKGGRAWGYRDTKNLTGDSLGHISHAIQCAKAILSGDTEVLNSSSLKLAYTEILMKRKEKEALALLGNTGLGEKKTLLQGGELPMDTSDIDAIFDDDDMLLVDDDAPPVPQTPIEVIEFPISEWLIQGECLDVMSSMPAGSVDHVVTDPPYGIELKNMDKIIKYEVKMTIPQS